MDDSVKQTSSEETQSRQHYTGKVSKVSMAAALVDIGTEKPAVLHISQLDGTGRQPIKRVEDVLEVGQDVEVWVRRVTDDVIQLTQIKPLELPWKDIKDGMIVKGTVIRLETFGAFVEIGAERPGLVHISEIAHGYVKTPGDVLKEGQEIETVVLESNRKKKQIKLSIKALEPAPETPERDENQQNREGRAPRRGGGRRGGRREERQNVNQILAEVNEPMEDTDTAMGAALRAAMESQNGGEETSKSDKKAKGNPREQDDILSRTLGQRS
jgi:predicted RNA-binding protein with RPS1 domain